MTNFRRHRIITWAGVASLLFAATACGTSAGEVADETTTTSTEASPGSGTTPDRGEGEGDGEGEGEGKGDGGGGGSTTTSSGGGDGDRDAAVAQMVDMILETENPYNPDDATAECIAESIVDTIGTEGVELLLAEEGSSDFDGFDEDTASQIVESWGVCGTDMKGLFVQSVGEAGATVEQASCVFDLVGNDRIAELFALGFTGDLDSPTVAAIQAEIRSARPSCE